MSRVRGVSRIEGAERVRPGHYARLTHQGITHARYFADADNGGKRGSFDAAEKYLKGIRRKLGVGDVRVVGGKAPKSGIAGVLWVPARKHALARLQVDGKQVARVFSAATYGSKAATIDAARKWRENAARKRGY